jgi:hypothetical protein
MDYHSFCNKLSNIYSNNLFYYQSIGRTRRNKVRFLAAISGSIIYGIFNNLIGNNIVTSIIGGALWFFVLKIIYTMKWLKALLITFIIWIITSLIGILIPTLPGPL